MTWLVSRAWTRNSREALAVYATMVLSMWMYAVRGGVYESSDQNGTVVLIRERPAATMVSWGLLAAGLSTAVYVYGIHSSWLSLTILLAAIFLCYVWAVAGFFILRRTSSAGSLVGPETPSGPIWRVQSLAQRPGTHHSAALLARQLIRDLPSGSVVVACARDDKMLESYVRRGFTRGDQRRVWYRVP